MNDEKILEIVNKCEKKLRTFYDKIDENVFNYSLKVLNSFKKNNVSESDFMGTSGYGYGDLGRDKIEKIFAEVLGGEEALVRNQIVSGSHALTITFFGLLRPNDNLLFISGTPYDTLHEVIGIKDNNSSLKSFGINYDTINLVDDDFDYDGVLNILKEKEYKVVEIQRSKGYSTRKSVDIKKVSKVIDIIKKVSPKTIVMVDNCYCEMVESISPLEVGADIIVGSLIKNLGGGIAPCGGYVVGKKNLVNLVAERLYLPGEGKEVGPSLGSNKAFLQGLYMAPSVIGSSLKVALLTSMVMENLGFLVSPRYCDDRCDIVQNIIFNDEKKLIKYVRGIQYGSAIDSNASVEPSLMPGYDDKIIMASGSFVQGSSIEISCDGPLREPFIAYQQGSISYEYGKLALISAIKNLFND